MKRLLVVLGFLGLLVLTLQTLRHAYVLWVEPTSTVLTQLGDKTKEDLAASKSIDELIALYKEAKRNEDAEARAAEKSGVTAKGTAGRRAEEVREAIRAWEEHSKEILGLHFFWWCGLGCIAVGGVLYRWVNGWVGSGLIVSGFLAMLAWTAPAFTALGARPEFERLLILKFIYSTATWALLVGIWICAGRPLTFWRLSSDDTVAEPGAAVKPRRESVRQGDGVLAR